MDLSSLNGRFVGVLVSYNVSVSVPSFSLSLIIGHTY